MKPDETNTNPDHKPQQSDRDAAAQFVRSQIDNYFNTDGNTSKTTPYQETHDEQTGFQTEQWKQYHTSWQEYYQKYYEGYYTHHLKKAQQALKGQATGSHNQYKTEPGKVPLNEEVISDLRQKLLGKVQDSAIKIKTSHHFIPIISGVVVVLVFLFLQYNRVLISNVMAYVSPGNIDPQNIVIDPNIEIKVGPEPRLIIPKINVDVPVIYDIGNDYDSQMAAMSKGVAQFAIPGASSHPGQVGNTVIAGHSSNDLFDSGDYKFIFAQLDNLAIGDTIYANYGSKRYTYVVTKKEVVKPSDVSKLAYPTTDPILTLVTCTPLGTSINRLLITAKQTNPDPNKSVAAPTKENDSKLNDASIPGNSPTLLERIFGSGN